MEETSLEEDSFLSMFASSFFPRLIPRRLSKNFRIMEDSDLQKLRALLINKALKQFPENHLNSKEFEKDLITHLYKRLEIIRYTIIPWIDHSCNLGGLNILEIGCGTGSSTVAIAEQGSNVVAIDVDESSLEIARARAKLLNLNVEFYNCNATNAHNLFLERRFDLIIFYACLEHMTYEERIAAMKNTWEMLPSGGYWCVADTPNRLWFIDEHTSMLPFFHWLPDNLAHDYSRFSHRDRFNELSTKDTRESSLEFSRWGRGVSFHEFELAMRPIDQLNVVSCLSDYWGIPNQLTRLRGSIGNNFLLLHKYESVIRRLCPDIPRAFFKSNLNLILRKD